MIVRRVYFLSQENPNFFSGGMNMPKRKYEPVIDDDEEEDEDGERLSVWDAAEIWASNGKDEDYMFGYSREDLENAL